MSASLEQLFQQLADPTTVHYAEEAYDLALARGLTGREREIFVGRLVDASRAGDGRAVLTLGYINAVETLPALIALAKTDDPLATYARRSVAMMGRGDEVADGLVLNVLGAQRTTDRIESLKELAKLDEPLARPTIQQALADGDFTVRSAAWEALVTMYGLRPLIAGPDGKRASTTHIELANSLLASDIEAFVRMGTHELQWAFRRLDAGATPASLGIAYVADQSEVFNALRRVLFHEEEPFPLDAIAKLTRTERRWAELIVAMRVENDDPRVAPALLQLGAVWTLPGLVDYARDHDDYALNETITGLESLARNGWILAFERPDPISVSTLEGVVSRVIGHPTTLRGELSGNPRDFYARNITITAHNPAADIYLQMSLVQTVMGEDDPNPINSINGAHLYTRGLSAEERTAAYEALRVELAELGFTGRVLNC